MGFLVQITQPSSVKQMCQWVSQEASLSGVPGSDLDTGFSALACAG